MNLSDIKIRHAQKKDAPAIAELIMMAMTDECCLHFCGNGFDLEDFREMMIGLVEHEHSQYSYRNTIAAVFGEKIVGISVSYDGGMLHDLREIFILKAKEIIGMDEYKLDDETQEGELYLDSLAVHPGFRRLGIAKSLIQATKRIASTRDLPVLPRAREAGCLYVLIHVFPFL